MGIDELIGDKRRTILDLAERYGITNVRVFGSVARGEAGPDSDVDLLVEVRPELSMEYLSLWADIEELLGRKVDLLTDRALDERMRRRILPDLVAL